MKKILLLLTLLVSSISFSQAPEGINYQAVIRNASGNLITSTTVAIRVQVRQTTATGTVVYQERHSVLTSSQGLVNMVIGGGTVQLGTFSSIAWVNGPFFVNLAVDFANGTNYQDFGTQQLMSVPYALFAKSSGNQLNQWRYGNTIPPSTLGNFGDFYLDVITGNVYYKNSGTVWVLTGNIKGPVGPTGLQGPAGVAGAQGPQGIQGVAGSQGAIGATGPQGLIGLTGPQGPIGLTGATGATGSQGPIGLTGPTGATGLQGPAGVAGAQGPQGVAGNNGANGINGTNGQNTLVKTTTESVGANCSTGGIKIEYGLDANNNGTLDIGEINATLTKYVCNGAVGATGPSGATGPQGAQGAQGPIGLTGVAGPTGATGLQGPIGLTGPQGIQGIAGTNGTNGLNALIKTTTESAGSNCTNGGTKIETGLDANGNGVLEAVEVNVSQTQFVCNGNSGGGSLTNGTSQGQMLYWNGTSWVNVPPGQTGQYLTFCYNSPQWGPCLAQITTSLVLNITGFNATSGGQIISDGGTTIASRGVCWDINPNPDLNDNFTTDGTGIGSFSSSIINLTPNTTYYVRAYAINSAGTVYGNQITFTSGANLPTVITGSSSNISYNSATISGQVTADGGATVTQRGVCYSTSQNPTISNSIVVSGGGMGTFSSSLTGLTGNTVYYARAFATNSSGTAYGSQITFTTFQSPAAMSCSGWPGPNASSSLMNAQGWITATIGQSIDISMVTTHPFITCCQGPNQNCGAASSIFNPSNANILSYYCGGQTISESISFPTAGIYQVTVVCGNTGLRTCNVSIEITP